jgi:hypothetical protein
LLTCLDTRPYRHRDSSFAWNVGYFYLPVLNDLALDDQLCRMLLKAILTEVEDSKRLATAAPAAGLQEMAGAIDWFRNSFQLLIPNSIHIRAIRCET